jgi:hypothetical protein
LFCWGFFCRGRLGFFWRSFLRSCSFFFWSYAPFLFAAPFRARIRRYFDMALTGAHLMALVVACDRTVVAAAMAMPRV